METLQKLLATLQGRDLEKEKRIKEEADAAAAKYPDAPEEEGIEPDYSLEETASLAFGGPAAQLGKRAGGYIASKAQKSVIEKLKDRGPGATAAPGKSPADAYAKSITRAKMPKAEFEDLQKQAQVAREMKDWTKFNEISKKLDPKFREGYKVVYQKKEPVGKGYSE